MGAQQDTRPLEKALDRQDKSPLPKVNQEFKNKVDSALAEIKGYDEKTLTTIITKHNNAAPMSQAEARIGGKFQVALAKGFGLGQKVGLYSLGVGQRRIGVLISPGDNKIADVEKGIIKGTLSVPNSQKQQCGSEFEYNMKTGALTVHNAITSRSPDEAPKSVAINNSEQLREVIKLTAERKQRHYSNQGYQNSRKY